VSYPLHGKNEAFNIQTDDNIVHLNSLYKDTAAFIFARAFQNDPFYRFVFPDEKKRSRELQWLMQKVVNYSLRYGDVYTTSEKEGVICWLPPHDTELTFSRIVRTGLHFIVFRFGLAAYRRFNDNMAYTGRLHKYHVPDPHWYLWAIGVDPSFQGKGIGGKLMQPVLASAGAAGTPCYLETHNQKNIPFYETHGFKVVGEGKVPKHDLSVWAMLRKGERF
jgi:ribosomal protein S18 acetylase RimI-like enzyme